MHCSARPFSVCNAISEVDLATLASTAVEIRLNRGRIFIQEGTPATDFFTVSAGTAKLYMLLPDGRQQITGFASVGHFLGLAVSQNYAFSAQALETVKLCRFSRPKLRHLMAEFPELEHRLLETACSQLAEAQAQMLLLGRKTASERVASFLMTALLETSSEPATRIHLPMTRGEIADYLGLTIETVSRTFSRFKAESRITIPSNDLVVVLDRPWLEHLAAGHA